MNIPNKVSMTTKILAACTNEGKGFSPEYFITRESQLAIGQYIRFKRYGMNALFADADAPETLLQAFDIIQNTLDKIQEERIKRPPK